jgi:hypothetical protein
MECPKCKHQYDGSPRQACPQCGTFVVLAGKSSLDIPLGSEDWVEDEIDSMVSDLSDENGALKQAQEENGPFWVPATEEEPEPELPEPAAPEAVQEAPDTIVGDVLSLFEDMLEDEREPDDPVVEAAPVADDRPAEKDIRDRPAADKSPAETHARKPPAADKSPAKAQAPKIPAAGKSPVKAQAPKTPAADTPDAPPATAKPPGPVASPPRPAAPQVQPPPPIEKKAPGGGVVRAPATPPLSGPMIAPRPSSPKPKGLLWAVIALACLALAGGGMWLFGRQSPGEGPAPTGPPLEQTAVRPAASVPIPPEPPPADETAEPAAPVASAPPATAASAAPSEPAAGGDRLADPSGDVAAPTRAIPEAPAELAVAAETGPPAGSAPRAAPEAIPPPETEKDAAPKDPPPGPAPAPAEPDSAAPEPAASPTPMAAVPSAAPADQPPMAEPPRPAPPAPSLSEEDLWIPHRYGKKAYYTIQTTTVKQKSVAAGRLRTLLDGTFPAYVLVRKNRQGALYYQVRIGRYPSKAKAQVKAAELETIGVDDYIIVRSDTPLPDGIGRATPAADTPG